MPTPSQQKPVATLAADHPLDNGLPDLQICQQARLSRDPRFDGLFFIAVKSTGIYCRTVCPVRLPAEHQVSYFVTAAAAATAGFRPCLRCRPDSAPGSSAWLGNTTTLRRALRLIDEGALTEQDLPALCQRLGISERYLRKLFADKLGISPKQYALYQQILFAKQLLHQTSLPVTDIAVMAGFHSLRRFHSAFKDRLQLTPQQVRGKQTEQAGQLLTLELSYRPPLDWPLLLSFWQQRTLQGLEWSDAHSYGRLIDWPPGRGEQHGWFEVRAISGKHALQLRLHWLHSETLWPVVRQIRRLLDLDADLQNIEQQLSTVFGERLKSGLRLPGVWSAWEAGIRAVLGQQVSVAAARTQLNRLLQLGQPVKAPQPSVVISGEPPNWRLFPTPAQLSENPLEVVKVPQARKATLTALAKLMATTPDCEPDQWLSIKGIGPWTVSYSKMRGLSEPDIWLGGDLGIQKALARQQPNFDQNQLAPWRSYATLQLWFGLAAQ